MRKLTVTRGTGEGSVEKGDASRDALYICSCMYAYLRYSRRETLKYLSTVSYRLPKRMGEIE